MRKLNILFLDWRLSTDKIERTLSSELNSTIYNLKKNLKEQLRNNDDLGKEMMQLIKSGKMLTTEIIGKLISKSLKEIQGNILLSEYPKTLEQFIGIKNVLANENIELDNIWYFKQREPNLFMKNHFENPIEKQWIDKYGDEIIEKWKTEFNKRREQIVEIKKASSINKWKIIEVDYIADLSSENIKQLIKDSA